MQMRPGRAAGRAELTDGLPDPYFVADAHIDRGKMGISRRKPVAVIDLDHLAVAAAPSGMAHGSGRGGAHRLAFVSAQIDAGVHRCSVEKRIDADAESGAHVDLAGDWLADRHGDERARERIDLRPVELHAVELALKRARLGKLRWHEWPAECACFRRAAALDAE